jgi:hypothetical protein
LVNMTLNASWLGKEVIADHCNVVRHFNWGRAPSIRSALFTRFKSRTRPKVAKSLQSNRIAGAEPLKGSLLQLLRDLRNVVRID